MPKRSTIGCDPEFFLVDRKSGKLLSSVGKIPGTKEEPHILKCGAGLQHDNVAVEFSSPVAEDGGDFVNKLRKCFEDLKENLPANTDITAIPSASFDQSELQTKEAKEFGCSPDYDAWKLVVNTFVPPEDETFRSCGGHVHVGHVEGDGNEFLQDPYGKVETVRAMDAVLGVTAAVLDNSLAAVSRRVLYGKAGCHRPTDYGVEYRVLSNFWLKSPKLAMLIDSLTQDALKIVREGKTADVVKSLGGEEKLVSMINESKTKQAEKALSTKILPLLSEESKVLLEECKRHAAGENLWDEWGV